MNDGLTELLAEIVEAAETQGHTQAEIVAQSGIGASSLSRAKRVGDMRVSTLTKLAKVVGLRLTLSPDVPMAVKIQNGELFK